MRYKATFIIGLVTGYVLGARAGRERYEAIARGTRRLLESPALQETAGVLQAQATGIVSEARRAVVGTVAQRFHGGGNDLGVVHSHNGHGG